MTAAPPPRRHAGVTATGIATSAAGLALVVWQISRAGSADVLHGLARVGAGFLIVLALAIARFVVRAYAWTRFIHHPVTIRRALAAMLAGDAAGNVTPLGLLASEPAKVLYLRDEVPARQTLAAAAAENFFYAVSIVLVIVTGMSALLVEFALPATLRFASWVSLGLMLVALAGALWLVWRRPRLASASLARLPFAAARGLVDRVHHVEAEAYRFMREAGPRLGTVVLCEVAFHLMSFAEAFLTLYWLTGSLSPLRAFILDSVGRVINTVFRIVPMRIGVDEASASVVAEALGYTRADGLALALVRRGRLIIWTIPGLLLIVRRGLTVRQIVEKS
jgi:hypothetical protein